MNLANMRIKKRLTTSFIIVAALLSAAGIIAAIAAFIMGRQYSAALVNYGFAQGDVGKMMTDFSNLRSDTRAIIGYKDAETISTIYADYETIRARFEEEMETVGAGLVSEEAKKSYVQLETAVDKYFQIEAEVQGLTDGGGEGSAAAQEKAINEMGPAYQEAYKYMTEIMDSKTQTGTALSTRLEIVVYVVVAAIVVLVVVGMIIALSLGTKVATGIAKPLMQLSDRFDRFSKGDLESEFPVYDRPDEVGC